MRRAVLRLLRLALLCVCAYAAQTGGRIQYQHLLPAEDSGVPIPTAGDVEGQGVAE